MERHLQNKVDMSLDDIIKLSRKEKKNAASQARGRGRGRGVSGQRGNSRGRGGNLTGRGRGRGQLAGGQIVSGKQNMRGVNRGGLRGRGGISRGRGRGRGAQRQNVDVGVSPMNRKPGFNTVKARGRGRGQRGRVNTQTLTFTNSNQSLASNTPQAQRRQRLNVVKAQAALLRKKEMAIKKLQTAKKTMQDINKALQKTSRGNLVDSKRGILTTTGAAQAGDAGNRKLLTGLMRQQSFKGSNMSLASNASGRQMMNTSVTITNQSANNNNNNNNRRRRQWRPKQADVTIQVANSQNRSNNYKPQPAKTSHIIDQLNMLKPANPTTYKFQKNVFATSTTTTVSLNDRFSSSSSSPLPDNGAGEGRKVFI